ncbi:MAG: NAD-dependent epimerase/dehydratase family protein [Dehalococcoidales bacterium]|nr:NAD-dependent epimerase/dehydratase family protein [Dehalococcoidales bacterium]
MIVAVTGASGHIGANLVRALLREDKRLHVLVHDSREGLEHPAIKTVRGNIDDMQSLLETFNGAEVVYHLAARISLSMHDWPEVEAVNVLGTRNVVEACLKCGVRRLVHFSSIHAIVQEPLDILLDETRPLVESSSCPPYDRSKAAAEREVQRGIERGLDAVILNPTAVIGPYDYRLSLLGEFLLSLARGKMPALVEGGFDWVDVRDVVEAALRTETAAAPGARYLISGHWAEVRELAELTSGILGISIPRFVCPAWLARGGTPLVTAYTRLTGGRQLFTGVSMRALTHCNRYISCARARHDLGYRPRPLKRTLADTFRWFRERGLLDVSIKIPSDGQEE